MLYLISCAFQPRASHTSAIERQSFIKSMAMNSIGSRQPEVL